MKNILLMLVLLVASSWAWGQELPDAPVPQPTTVSHSDGFFAVRTDFNAPALRPNKKAWIAFVASHAAAWGALATANHQKEPFGTEAVALGAVTALDFGVFKLFNPLAADAPAVYAFQHYMRAR